MSDDLLPQRVRKFIFDQRGPCRAVHPAASLTPDQVHALSIPIYSRKLARDYARPSRQEPLDHFAAIGLTGDYWQL
jgi:hypothetical protein